MTDHIYPPFEVFEVPYGMQKRFIVAQFLPRSHSYSAAMTARSRRLTGCSAVSAPTPEGLARSANVQIYRAKSAAKRAAKAANEGNECS